MNAVFHLHLTILLASWILDQGSTRFHCLKSQGVLPHLSYPSIDSGFLLGYVLPLSTSKSKCPEFLPVCQAMFYKWMTLSSTEVPWKSTMHISSRFCNVSVTMVSEKRLFMAKCVTFLRHVFDQNGVHPDSAKVQGIHDFPPCSNESDVYSFMGMVNQFGNFTTKIAAVSQPIRDLLKESAWV